MISFRNATKFCCEDLSYIENYYDAINDKTQTWCCHHRLETDKNLSRDQLIECNLYFNRPASELIFLTSKEHMHLHNSGDRNPMYGKDFRKYMSDNAIEIRRQKYVGKNNPMYGKNHSNDTKQLMKINSPDRSGKNNPVYGQKRKWLSNGIIAVHPKLEEIQNYLDLGYHFGRK